MLLLIMLLVAGYATRAAQHHGSTSNTPGTSASAPAGLAAPVPLSQLAAQARQTVALIRQGGPFPYSHDGIVYQNRERQLPGKPAGFYHEYTVPTPGEADRGPRRIVTGQDGTFWYTDDHYASFRRIDLSG
ncbi:MAG TPA: ribonuclease domain-containing protein [Jatrophihabitans sp.]|nr:ribonuclease domain-containing protein [Jatrophihabitans sp.]